MEEIRKVFIYALLDPDTKEIRYIGKANNIEKRLKSHLLDSKTRNTPLYCWIRKLRSLGKIPEIKLIKETTSFDWQKKEISQIKFHIENGFNLLNLSKGGNEPYSSSEVRRDNGRETALKIHSDPKRKRMWRLKLLLGQYFKEVGDTTRVLEMKCQLAQKGIYFK